MELSLFEQSNTPLAGKGIAKSTSQHYTQSMLSLKAPYRHNGPKGTPDVAAAMISSHSGFMRDRVYRAIAQSGGHGLTDDEGKKRLDMVPQSYTSRRREIVIQGVVKDSGNRCLTRKGRTAAVKVTIEQLEGGEA